MHHDAITDAHTFAELIDRRADRTPHKIMLVDPADHSLTYGEYRDRVLRVVAGLTDHGVTPSSTVAWQLPSRIDTVVLAGALARIGACQVPIIHLYREREIGFAVGQLSPSHLFTPGTWKGIDFEAMAERACEDVASKPVLLSGDLPEGDPSALPPPPRDGEAVRWIYYTSGSTADPKGVRHCDRSLLAGGLGLADALALTPDDVGTIAFPFAHIGGADYLVTMLAIGFTAVVVEEFKVTDVVPLFRRHGVTIVGGSTAFYVAYLATQRAADDTTVSIFPNLRLMSGGGAPKPPEIHAEVRDEIGGRGVVHGYGMTEVPMIANGSPSDSDDQLAHTDGRPVLGADVRIVRLSDGVTADPDEEGEIRVRGPIVFAGYTDPSLDADAFDTDGWFRTGDLGRLRSDGHLVISGRLKDVIVRKGENISATEVEAVLYGHPAVKEVAVIGLPDRERGERVCAVVELAAGVDGLSLADVASFCKEAGLMTQKIPEQVEIRSTWPRGGTGKVLKKVLREEYDQA